MRNIINIDAAAGFIDITKESGANTTIIKFLNISGTTQSVEFYKGNKFYKFLPCRILNEEAAATLPQEVFEGNNLHFRLIQDGDPGPFFHIVFDPKLAYIFNPLNNVVFSNKISSNKPQTITPVGKNTYNNLHPFTQDQLAAFSYKTLKGGTL